MFLLIFLFFNRYNHNGITIIECHEHEANHLQFACSFLRASNAWLCHIKVQYHGRLPYEMMIDVEIATKSKTSFNIIWCLSIIINFSVFSNWYKHDLHVCHCLSTFNTNDLNYCLKMNRWQLKYLELPFEMIKRCFY